jgi:hypothetical protein
LVSRHFPPAIGIPQEIGTFARVHVSESLKRAQARASFGGCQAGKGGEGLFHGLSFSGIERR